MKKAIKILLILTLFSVMGTLVWKSINKIDAKQKRHHQIAEIPRLQLQCLDDRCTQLHDLLKDNKGLLLILFNSECEHCQNEAKLIHDNLEEFHGVNIVFVSAEETNAVARFKQKYFGNKPALTFATASQEQLSTAFNEITYPNIYLYNAGGKLTREFRGQIQMTPIIKCIQQGC